MSASVRQHDRQWPRRWDGGGRRLVAFLAAAPVGRRRIEAAYLTRVPVPPPTPAALPRPVWTPSRRLANRGVKTAPYRALSGRRRGSLPQMGTGRWIA